MKLFGSLCLLLLCVGISSQKTMAQTPAYSVGTPAISQAKPATQTSLYTLPPDKLAKSKALYDLEANCGSLTLPIRCWCCWHCWRWESRRSIATGLTDQNIDSFRP